jgi:hypothetical protein
VQGEFILIKLILSLFVNTLSHHQKCLHDNLFNVYVTPIESDLKLQLHPLTHFALRRNRCTTCVP